MSSILFDSINGIATITLNRPQVLNAFNREMALSFQDALEKCAADDAIRVVMITGAGKAFSAGQDLAEVTDPEGPGMKRILSEHYNPIVRRIRGLQKPVVAVVNGVAAGAGANIALCCDVVIATEGASFIQAFSKIGLIPDSGGTYTLPRLIGWQKASAIMMLGDKISATEAAAMGMIYKSYAEDVFQEASMKLVQALSQMPTRGLAYTKQALNLSFINDFNTQLEAEDTFQQRAAQTADYKEGVDAFLAKRKPVFKGK
jgi:2-(1,2-epoxy-1,2-dihydrophenyl)acetyl-CoA isomerase